MRKIFLLIIGLFATVNGFAFNFQGATFGKSVTNFTIELLNTGNYKLLSKNKYEAVFEGNYLQRKAEIKYEDVANGAYGIIVTLMKSNDFMTVYGNYKIIGQRFYGAMSLVDSTFEYINSREEFNLFGEEEGDINNFDYFFIESTFKTSEVAIRLSIGTTGSSEDEHDEYVLSVEIDNYHQYE